MTWSTLSKSRASAVRTLGGYPRVRAVAASEECSRATSHERGILTTPSRLVSVERAGRDIPTYTDQGRNEPPCLLHAMLMFWANDGAAELCDMAELSEMLADAGWAERPEAS